ncbi:MAG: hypothetical protein LDL25_10335, partial [Hyphomicrobiales bacterium]|nr:hypothetical protein [Hyphomicrobiales bacterium]
LDALGRAQGVIALVNLAGFAGLVLVAVLARDYKGGGKPGSAPRSRPEAASNGGDAVPRATPAE